MITRRGMLAGLGGLMLARQAPAQDMPKPGKREWAKDIPVMRIGLLGGENDADRLARVDGYKKLMESTFEVPVKLLVADCSADLNIRGMAQHEGKEAKLGEGRLALTFEDAESGQIYQSLVPLEGSSMAEIFENYLARSEQRTSFLRLHANESAVCGLFLEKLPLADARDSDGWNRVTHLAATLRLDETVDAQPYGLLVKLKSGVVILSGDTMHAREAAQLKAVPVFNTDREQSLQSMERLEKITKDTGAKLVIQHDDRDIALLPAFPKAAE
jgi:hypothetical protein